MGYQNYPGQYHRLPGFGPLNQLLRDLPPTRWPSSLTDLDTAVTELLDFVEGWLQAYTAASTEMSRLNDVIRGQGKEDMFIAEQMRVQLPTLPQWMKYLEWHQQRQEAEVQAKEAELKKLEDFQGRIDRESKTIAVRVLSRLKRPIPAQLGQAFQEPLSLHERIVWGQRARPYPIFSVTIRQPLQIPPPPSAPATQSRSAGQPVTHEGIQAKAQRTRDGAKQLPKSVDDYYRLRSGTETILDWAKRVRADLLAINSQYDPAVKAREKVQVQLWNMMDRAERLGSQLERTGRAMYYSAMRQVFWQFYERSVEKLQVNPTMMRRFTQVQQDIVRLANHEVRFIDEGINAVARDDYAEFERLQKRMNTRICQFLTSVVTHVSPPSRLISRFGEFTCEERAR